MEWKRILDQEYKVTVRGMVCMAFLSPIAVIGFIALIRSDNLPGWLQAIGSIGAVFTALILYKAQRDAARAEVYSKQAQYTWMAETIAHQIIMLMETVDAEVPSGSAAIDYLAVKREHAIQLRETFRAVLSSPLPPRVVDCAMWILEELAGFINEANAADYSARPSLSQRIRGVSNSYFAIKRERVRLVGLAGIDDTY